MEAISKDTLEKALLDKKCTTESAKVLKVLIKHCKELPIQQWQTIDEFKANPVDGWCWIQHKSLKTTMSYYKRVFTVDGEMFACEYITHVMPIKTPEAPK